MNLSRDIEALKRQQRAALATVLRRAVWGDSVAPVTSEQLYCGLIRWHVERSTRRPLDAALDDALEAVDAGLIMRRADGKWTPGLMAPEA